MTRITRQVGGPKEGGHRISMSLPCDRDWASMTDVQLLYAWKDHRAGRCGC